MIRRNPEQFYLQCHQIALQEFADIVMSSITLRNPAGRALKHRFIFTDSSYLDIYYGETGKYSFHWERMHVDGRVYRHDNAPHNRWNHLRTFPKHFHNGTQNNVQESDLPDEPTAAIRTFLIFIREIVARI